MSEVKSCGKDTCLLYPIKKYPICKWWGNPKADVLIIGEPPSFQDNRLRAIFEDDQAFAKMQKYLGIAGIDERNVFYASICRCQINKRDMPIQKDRDAVVQTCHSFALTAIAKIKPKLIITMGDYALQHIAGKKKITRDDVHGNIFWSDKFNCWICPVFGLSYIYRNEGKEEIVYRDFANIKVLVKSNYTKAEVVHEKPEKNYSELQSLAEYYKGKLSGPVALDTETQGLRWDNFPFICLGYSICVGEEAAHWITLFEETTADKADFKIYWDRVVPGGITKQKIKTRIFVKMADNFERKIKELKQLMESPKAYKIFHHVSYDVHAMARAVELAGYLLKWPKDQWILRPQNVSWDTQFAAHVMDENIYKLVSLEKLQAYLIPDEMPYNYNAVFGSKYDKSDMLAIQRDNKDDFISYAASDAEVTWRIWRRQMQFFNKPENKKLLHYVNEFGPRSFSVLTELEKNGLLVDAEKVPAAIESVISQQADHVAAAIKAMPPKIKERYADNLKLTRDCVVRDTMYSADGFKLPVKKRTGTTGEPSVDKDVRKLMLEELKGDAFDFLMNYHEFEALNTIRTRYLKSLVEDKATDGRIHPNLSLCNTDTGRSSSSPNLQNLPKRGKHASSIRGLFVAPPGWEMLKADESQAELRWAAVLSGDETMKDVFRADGDIHVTTGEQLAKRPWHTLSPEDQAKYRQNAKPANFGLLYLMSPEGFQLYAKLDYGLDLTIEECKEIINTYFNTYSKLPLYHERTIAFGEKHGYVQTPFGRRRRLPELNSTDRGIRSQAQRKAVNIPIQGASSDLVVIAGSEILKMGLPASEIQMNMFIHDELIFYVKKGYAEKYAPIVKRAMEHPPLHKFGIKLDIPLRSDVSVGPNFYDCKEVKFDGYNFMGYKEN